MPSEFLDSYGEQERDGGIALLNRVLNKVYVSNKISSEEELTRFLINLEKGISPKWNGLLGIGELKPLADQVEFESEGVRQAFATVRAQFLRARRKKAADSRIDSLQYPKDKPDYYVTAAGSVSNRSFVQLFDQFKSRFIVHQLMQGVAFKDIRTTVTMKDLNLFFEGLGYWAPQKITSNINTDGNLEFKSDSQVIDRLLSSGVVDSRVRFHLEKMRDEAVDYAQIAQSVAQDFMREYTSEITKYPDLFPSSIGAKAPGTLPTDIQKKIAASIDNLSRFKLNHELAKVQGLAPPELATLKQDYLKKEAELIKYLEDNRIMTKEQLRERMKEIIKKLQTENGNTKKKEDHKKAEQKRATKSALDPVNLAKKIIMHEVPAGIFEMGAAKVKTEITKPFYMMANPLTQMMSSRIMIALGATDPKVINPSKYVDGPDSILAKIEGFDIQMRPDHPVETISHDDVMNVLLPGLNKLSNSNDVKIQELLKMLIPDHQKGDHYDIWTEAQMEYVMKMAKTADGDTIDAMIEKNDLEKLKQYVVFDGNSDSTIGTHAVGSKLPLFLNGKPIYLNGNVWEWTKDAWDGISKLPGGKDPLGTTGSLRFFRGGSWAYGARLFHSNGRFNDGPGRRHSDLGVRLVRASR